MSNVKKFSKTEAVPECSSWLYTAAVRAGDNTPLVAAQVDEIRLTLRDIASDGIVNAREDVDMKATAEADVDEGLLSIRFTPDDMVAVGEATFQQRRFTLDLRLAGGGRVTHEVWFFVQAMQDVEL